MMKKITAAGIVALLVFFLLCSCQTSPLVWDDSYPEEKLATVSFYSMKIDSYNGISVRQFNWVKIPAGETRLGGDVYIVHAGITFVTEGMEFTGNFEAGHAYGVTGAVRDMRWGVVVYNHDTGKKWDKDNEVAFIPFKNQPVFN